MREEREEKVGEIGEGRNERKREWVEKRLRGRKGEQK